MQSNWRIGSLFGIPFYIDSSWLLILVFLTVINASDINASNVVEGQPVLGWVAGFVMALLLFVSVLLHELGHSLVAKNQGIEVNSITLFLFGGVASIAKESKNPREAFQVAIAGPVVSILLFALFLGLSQVAAEDSLPQFITSDLGRINLVLALFNLIPGLPLDGGQVLKAAVWQVTGSRSKGVRWAAATGKILGWFGIILGLFLVLVTAEVGAIWLTLIGWFILRNAAAYDQASALQKALLEIVAADAMTRDFRVIDAKLTLRDFAEEFVLANSQTPKPYYASSDGRYRGLIDLIDLQAKERSQWDYLTLLDIAQPLTEIPSVEEKSSLVEVINKLEEQQLSSITVLSPAGAVAGIIDRADVVRALGKKQNLLIPEEEIKRIKTEGTYPQGLQLNAIAKAIKEE
ncbi:MAG: site-2 protease family protein [Spirulinaceae cyanobacterium]